MGFLNPTQLFLTFVDVLGDNPYGGKCVLVQGSLGSVTKANNPDRSLILSWFHIYIFTAEKAVFTYKDHIQDM